jgi:putative component of membrane protein insertase Oxa1/YidC/SpoIIIJ protein YidD
MRHLLLAAIRAYWTVWPRHLNRRCLYRETCSQHVYRMAREGGVAAGLLAFTSRVRKCRPGYAVSTVETRLGLILRDGSFLPDHLVAEDVLAPIQLAITQLEQCLSQTRCVRDGE